jgi:hypothetical protein
MVARRHSVRKATIRRTIEAVISAGHIVSAVKIDPDGSIRVVCGETGAMPVNGE